MYYRRQKFLRWLYVCHYASVVCGSWFEQNVVESLWSGADVNDDRCVSLSHMSVSSLGPSRGAASPVTPAKPCECPGDALGIGWHWLAQRGITAGHDNQLQALTSLLLSNPIELWPALLCFQHTRERERERERLREKEREKERESQTDSIFRAGAGLCLLDCSPSGMFNTHESTTV